MFSHRILLVFGLAAAAGGARASSLDGRLAASGGAEVPEVLSAGTIAGFAWDAGDRSGVDEMELVLSLDGGKTFPLRITGDISPATRQTTWRVPALPAEHARLALRAGRGEEEENESILFVSHEFAIRLEANAGLEKLCRVRGEWRTHEALEGSGREPVEPGLAGSPSDELRAASAGAAAIEAPRTVSLSRGQDSLQVRAGASFMRPSTASSSDIQRPRFVPLRS